jgi:radical SAM superfamily enzyme YgiQ (UPF0313 family)
MVASGSFKDVNRSHGISANAAVATRPFPGVEQGLDTLEAAGFRVGIVSQPDWRKVDDWRRFGRPRLFFAISAGNMDSMINHYTANRKVRNSDAYSPGGRIGLNSAL